MKFSYEVRDGSEVILKGVMSKDNELEVRKELGRSIKDHRFTSSIVVLINGEEIVNVDRKIFQSHRLKTESILN